MEAKVSTFRDLLKRRCGSDISFTSADQATEADLAGRHLIIIGNISDNRWALALYKRRHAFADSYFPGAGGYVIHPAKSLWDQNHNVLVIGTSTSEDIAPAFEAFLNLLPSNPQVIPCLRKLKTSLSFPTPPQSVDAVLERARTNLRPNMAPYATIANWGIAYALTGDKKWAEYFVAGFRLCFERARKTGLWIPEYWTNVYFCLWKMVHAWELIDDDPMFTAADRKLIDEVLWGYAHFCEWLPNLDPALAPPGEARQNHTTFLALSLYYSRRYFKTKYGIDQLDSTVAKIKRAFEDGQGASYRPNDDAGTYLIYGPLHFLTYQMAEGNDSWLRNNNLKRYVDLLLTTVDNRNDHGTFGDVGGYRHRGSGSARGPESIFFGVAAWFYRDPAYRWLYNWISSTAGSASRQPFGFSFEELYTGCYAVESPEKPPSGIFGVHPVLLDDASLRFVAMRARDDVYLPRAGEQYIDKLAFRRDLDPNSEYLLLDGTSVFSHGHHDGNTVTRLTWRDRLWLFESDYTRLTPKYHMGIVVTRDGVQEPPPPLTSLEFATDAGSYGMSRTVSRGFNGADWARNIIWAKGKYFFFLDQVTARQSGNFRLESRFRAVGDAERNGNEFRVRQGNLAFFIRSADDAPRQILQEAVSLDYPYGKGHVAIDYARKTASLPAGGKYEFAHLMYVDPVTGQQAREVRKVREGLYLVSYGTELALVGHGPKSAGATGRRPRCKVIRPQRERSYPGRWFRGAAREGLRSSRSNRCAGAVASLFSQNRPESPSCRKASSTNGFRHASRVQLLPGSPSHRACTSTGRTGLWRC